jgi:hypothetical protein
MSDGGTLSPLGAALINDAFALAATIALGVLLALIAHRRAQSSKPEPSVDTQLKTE